MTRIPGEEPKRCHSENGDMPILQNGDSHLTKESLQNGLEHGHHKEDYTNETSGSIVMPSGDWKYKEKLDIMHNRSPNDSKNISIGASQTSPNSTTSDQSIGEESSDSNRSDSPPENTQQQKSALEPRKDLIVIQDTGFNVTIHAPGLEPFDLPVSSMELVQELYQVMMDREDTCQRTCFSIQFDGVRLDNFAELKTVEGLKEGSVLEVVEDKRRTKPEIDCTPPDYIMPDSRERPILPLHPITKEQKAPQCVRVLTYSGWNPPPGNRRMHGDLLYLYVVTLEDKRFHITASTRGFYVNQSTAEEFNPKPATQKYLSHSLVDLLQLISPAFKKSFGAFLKFRGQKHPFERVATPYQVYSWLAPQTEHSVDYIRAEDAFSSRLGYEEQIPGQTRDWNEELQTTRELPRKTLPERLIRERTIFKVHSDFVVAATRGAIAVIDGNIMAINPGEDPKMQMYLWNNIFFSLGFDVKDHYKDFGGDCAAYVAPSNDLQGLRAYTSVDPEGLYTLGTVVVDYRGYRITAQSIIPGILEREQDESVVYGSIDFGKTVVHSEKYKELLKKTSTALKICPHKVLNEKEEEVELLSSVECKGIVGNDGRHYLLDLLRTFPPDVNFLQVEGEELSNDVKELGFPRNWRHKLACLRQELVDAFVENRYITFVKCAACHFQQSRMLRLQEELEKKRLEASALEQTNAGSDAGSGPEAVGDAREDTEASKAADDSASAQPQKGDDVTPKATPRDTIAKSEPTQTAVSTQVPQDGSRSILREDMDSDEAKKIVAEMTRAEPSNDAQGQLQEHVPVPSGEEHTREVVSVAAKAVGSLCDHEFSVMFNPDVFQNHVRHANPEGESLKRQVALVKDAAEFLLLQQIPSFVRECLDHTNSPIDGHTLSEALHHAGVNLRYLGRVTDEVAKHVELYYLKTICITELICRSAKHVYKQYMQGVEAMSLAAAISHFLNCMFGSFAAPQTHVATDELQSQRARKRNKRRYKMMVLSADSLEWASETPRSIWKKIVDEMQDYFYYTMDSESLDSASEAFGLQKISVLRTFCKKLGVQLLLREYALDSRTKQCFFDDDIINVFPIVKNINPRASDAYHVFTSGQNKIQQGLLRDGYELISEALNLLSNVYGAMHPETAACCRLLARLNYIMGDYSEAMAYQQRAVQMSERVQGIDHPNTITEYAHLALYCFANNQITNALKLMYRARYLALLCFGEAHPEVALFDSNIGLILHAVGEFDLSLRFLQKALELNIKFFTPRSLKVAMNYHLVARALSCKGDFRSALQNEKEAYTIYRTILGEEHDRAKESSECLKHLTQQAVKFQKTMNEICKGEKNVSIPPIQVTAPSLSNVLETLNLINGIVFLHISQEDIDRFREEMINRQKGATSSKTDDNVASGDKAAVTEPGTGDEAKVEEHPEKQSEQQQNGGSS